MKLNTRKATRIIQAQSTIIRKLDALKRGNSFDNREQIAKLDKLYLEYENKLQALAPLISEEEFDTHLASTMCCEYSDFNNQ